MRVTTLGVSSEISALASSGRITAVTIPPATVPIALVNACRLDMSEEKASPCRTMAAARRQRAGRNAFVISLWSLELSCQCVSDPKSLSLVELAI